MRHAPSRFQRDRASALFKGAHYRILRCLAKNRAMSFLPCRDPIATALIAACARNALRISLLFGWEASMRRFLSSAIALALVNAASPAGAADIPIRPAIH